MRSVAMTEWVLAKFTGKQHAAAMMGDLLEQRDQKGAWWFWRSLIGALLALAWRPVLGFVITVYASDWAFKIMATQGRGMWATTGLVGWLSVGQIAWFIAVYSGVRYGVRDALAQMAGAVAFLAATAIFLSRNEWAYRICAILAICLMMACSTARRGRRAAMAFVGSGLAFLVVSLLASIARMDYPRYVLHISISGLAEFWQRPSSRWINFAISWLDNAVIAWLCARMHRRLLEPQQPEATPVH